MERVEVGISVPHGFWRVGNIDIHEILAVFFLVWFGLVVGLILEWVLMMGGGVKMRLACIVLQNELGYSVFDIWIWIF